MLWYYLVNHNSTRTVKDPAWQGLIFVHHLFNLFLLCFCWRGGGVAPLPSGKYLSVKLISKYLWSKNPLALPDCLWSDCMCLQLGWSACEDPHIGAWACIGSQPDALLPSFQDLWSTWRDKRYFPSLCQYHSLPPWDYTWLSHSWTWGLFRPRWAIMFAAAGNRGGGSSKTERLQSPILGVNDVLKIFNHSVCKTFKKKSF